MASFQTLVRSSILPQHKEQTHPVSRTGFEFDQSLSNSIGSTTQNGDIELRQRKTNQTQESTVEQDVIHPHLSSLPSAREASSNESQCDSGQRYSKSCHSRRFKNYWSPQLSSTAARNTPVPTIPSKVLEFECDEILGINSNITISLVNCDDSWTKRADFGSKIARYHAQISGCSFSAPDIVLKRLPQKTLPPDNESQFSSNTPAVVSMAYFRWSRNVRMGFDYYALSDTSPSKKPSENGKVFEISNEHISWEEMRNTSKWQLHYRYDFEIPLSLHNLLDADNDDHGKASTFDVFSGEERFNTNNNMSRNSQSSETQTNTTSTSERTSLLNSTETPDTDRVRLVWYRTNRPCDGATSCYSRFIMMNYKLLLHHPSTSAQSSTSTSASTSTCIATFMGPSSPSLKKRGTLRLFGNISEELEQAIVLSMLAINEKASRRRCYAFRGVSAGP